MRSADPTTTCLPPAPTTTRPVPPPTTCDTTTSSTPDFTTVEALDLAFGGERCELVQADGTTRVMPVHRWTREASPADDTLFVSHCEGPTLDVGCGPGRLTAAVARRGLPALGIDISTEAVRQTRQRGARAVVQDVFTELSGATLWQHVLLADGNIGLGGDPLRLLVRVGELLAPHGSALVEVAGPGGGEVHEQVRLRVGGRLSLPFDWATVGVDTIAAAACSAGLYLDGIQHDSGRYVATLRLTGAPS